MALAPAGGAAAPPSKPDTTRKAFDYRQPDPGEMLPNPPAGIGTPPRLLEYSPTAAMGEASAGVPPQGAPPATTATAERPPALESPPAAAPPLSTPAKPAPAPAPPPSTAPPPPAAAGAAPSPPDLQALFAATLVTAGIDGVPATLPAAGVPPDPALRPAAERAWATLASSLAASATAWARRHPDRTPTALDRVEARPGPGRLIILTAPGRLTGASDHPPP